MTYLELCQEVRARMGIQGSGPSTVVATTDLERDIVEAVRDAWLDIQNHREDWDWMRATASFNMVAGTTTYNKATIGGGASHRINKYIKNRFWLNDGSNYSRMVYLQEDNFDNLYKNDSTQNQPYNFTIRRVDGTIAVSPPDSAYACTIDYYKQPQELTADANEPEIDEHWHNLIIYLACQKLSASIGSATTAMEFGQAYAVMLGQLMRSQLYKKSVKMVGIA